MSRMPPPGASDLTPMMRQYMDMKQKHPDSFLFFRMGDFYEMFFEDAVKASRILGITLTHRGTYKGQPIPMCGVPHHSVEAYLGKLIAVQCKVSICEQVEDPREAKGIVRREVQRTITPGTVIDDALLKANRSNHLASVHNAGSRWGFSYAELSTGEFQVAELQNIQELERELSRIDAREILIPKALEPVLHRQECLQGMVSRFLPQADWIYEHTYAYQQLLDQFRTHSLDGFGLADAIPGVCAAGALLHYVRENCPVAMPQVTALKRYHLGNFMSLDEATLRNLELFAAGLNGTGRALVDILDATHTPMGARNLRAWLHAPLRDLDAIEARQEAVAELRAHFEICKTLGTLLGSVGDLERITGRILCGSASPRDLLGLKRALETFPAIRRSLTSFKAPMLAVMPEILPDFSQALDWITRGIEPEAPAVLRDGGVIRSGFDGDLDALRALSRDAKTLMAGVQQAEVEKTGIKNMKIRYNQVFGYYFEVSKGQLAQVPDYFIRKQTLVNAERYITPELKELESRVLGAEQQSLALENRLFQEICRFLAAQAGGFKMAARQIAILDTLLSFAHTADQRHYQRPRMRATDLLRINEGRHPVVENLLEAGTFIPNDTLLDCGENQIALITGPNMAGKSTYLRQVALIVLLAQVGCPVPAKEAELGIVDRIFTRVGASDDQTTGKSTFMVEMNETAGILNAATPRSLIILDEIGRGTSTFDGMAIAWAVMEYLSYQSSVKAKTLFATHYHELTSLETQLPGVRNFNIAVKEWNEDILFLRKIVPGPADKSYGIHVARLAGLPRDVLNRAREILVKLESGTAALPARTASSSQLDLFRPAHPGPDPMLLHFLEKLAALETERMTPLEAIQVLDHFVKEARQTRGGTA